MEEVVVTATKRPELMRDIPSSMAVFGGEKLEMLGARKVKDVLDLVPGVSMQEEIAGVQRKVSVRGVGPDTGTNQSVGSVMGDVPISDPYGGFTSADPNPWDMRTVEVLKGPQGTLFGATSLAGLIRYVPNSPELGEWQGKAFYEYSTLERGSTGSTYGAALNIPVGETAALRASGISQELPGLYDSDNPARQEKDTDSGSSWSGRIMGLWQPTDRLAINAWYMKDRRQSDDLGVMTYNNDNYVRDDAPTASTGENRFNLGVLDLRYSFDWVTVVSLTGYQEKFGANYLDASQLIPALARAGTSYLKADREVKTKGLAQELRLVSPEDGSSLNWIFGAFYSGYTADILTQLYVPSAQALSQIVPLLPEPLLNLIIANDLVLSSSGYHPLDATEEAIFGEVNYAFSDSIDLTLGGRKYKTEVTGVLESGGASSNNDGAEPGSAEEGWSPKIALSYKPTDDLMFYATVSRGFQFGGFNLPTVPSPDIPLTFESSTLWNHEIGMRTDWFDRTLRFDLTAFFLDWTNPQVKQVQSPNTFVDNVGGTYNIGAETTIRWLTPLDGFSIEQTASYIEARTNEVFTDVSGAEVPKGTIMSNSPRAQLVTTLAYIKPIAGVMTQTSLINSYRSKSWADITHRTPIDDYSLLSLNFNVSWIELPGAPSVNLSVNNLTNVQTVVTGFSPAPGGPEATFNDVVASSSYVYSRPRSVSMRLSMDF